MEGKILCYCEARTITKIGMTAGNSFKRNKYSLINYHNTFIIKTNFGIVFEWFLIIKFAVYKTKLINRKYGISNNRRYF
jgi:hypothetical protein